MAWYNPNWQNRKSKTISASADGTQTNYAMLWLRINKSTGSEETVDIGGSALGGIGLGKISRFTR